jgi:hypothetical protein
MWEDTFYVSEFASHMGFNFNFVMLQYTKAPHARKRHEPLKKKRKRREHVYSKKSECLKANQRTHLLYILLTCYNAGSCPN